jgi:hypothetical protein
MSVYRQNDDGSWSPAEPLGWGEEHNRFARLIFWLRRLEHCNDKEGQKRSTWRRGRST